LQEPGIVELKDGKLMMFCRTESGLQYFSYSDDQGMTWSPISPGNIRSPLSPASIERIPSTGDLLLLWNNNYEEGRDGGKRTPYNLAISKDEGKTWQKIKTIESDPAGWYCYTAIEFVDDHVLLGHCAGDTRTNNGLSTTQITRLNREWIYSEASSDPYVASENDGKVVLTCTDKNTQIRYTLDGSLPGENSGLVYKDSIVIDRVALLNMQSFKAGKTPGRIISVQIGSTIYQKAEQLIFKPEQGLIYNYFEGEIDRTLDIEKLPVISSGVMPDFSIKNSPVPINFAYTFDGYIKIPKDGLYTFYLNSNDGSVLYLDDLKIIDNDGAHGAYMKSTSISLNAGMHKIKLKYFQAGGGSLLKVLWEGPGFTKKEINPELLFHNPKLLN